MSTMLGHLSDGAFQVVAGCEDAPARIALLYTAPTLPADAAREEITRHVRQFLDRAFGRHRLSENEKTETLAEHAAMVSTVGTGKSSLTRAELTESLPA
jgi:hypothetical protein